MQVKLIAPIQYAIELCETDSRGERVPRERQTVFPALVPLDCESTDHSIAIGVHLRGEVPMKEVNAVKDESERLFSVAATIANTAFDDLPRRYSWNLHGITEIRVSIPLTPVSIRTGSVEREVEIKDELANALKEETARIKEGEQAFDRAKDYLFNSLTHSICGDERRARSAAQYMCSCVRAGSNGYMTAWCDEKTSALMGAISDLAKRKNPNHPNYRSTADRAQGYVYNLRFPSYWADPPPSPRMLNLD